MRGIHDGNMTGHPIVHMHITNISKEEVSHTKEGAQPSRNSQAIVHGMCIHRLSSVPTELLVADFISAISAIRRALLEGHFCIHEGQKENAFSGAHKRAKVLRHTAFSGVP